MGGHGEPLWLFDRRAEVDEAMRLAGQFVDLVTTRRPGYQTVIDTLWSSMSAAERVRVVVSLAMLAGLGMSAAGLDPRGIVGDVELTIQEWQP